MGEITKKELKVITKHLLGKRAPTYVLPGGIRVYLVPDVKEKIEFAKR